MAYDVSKMADWQIAEAAEEHMPNPEEWRQKLGLKKEEILAYGKVAKLASVLEVMGSNAHHHDRVRLFEIGPVFLGSETGALPDEVRHLVIALAGPRAPEAVIAEEHITAAEDEDAFFKPLDSH